MAKQAPKKEALPRTVSPDTILDTAKGLVYGQRNKDYGHPEDNFQTIARLWNAYRDAQGEEPITPIDVAMFNILQKVARVAVNHTHRDSIVDIAGYAATVERIVDGK